MAVDTEEEEAKGIVLQARFPWEDSDQVLETSILLHSCQGIQMRLFTWHRHLLLAWDSVHCFKFLTSLLGWSVDVCDHCHQLRQDLWQGLAITRPPLWCHHTCRFLVQKYFGVFSDHFNLKFLMILRSIQEEGIGSLPYMLLLKVLEHLCGSCCCLNSLLSLNLRVESLPFFFLFFLLH